MADLTYTWTLVDLATQRPVADAQAATPAEFAREHGDGRGFVTTGFGCDGTAFNIDAVQAAGVRWDFEGVPLVTTIANLPATAEFGDKVVVTGTVTDAEGRRTGDPLVLQARTGGGAWQDVSERTLSDPDGVTRVQVVLERTAEFRWHRPESQYADEGVSNTATTNVVTGEPEQTVKGQ